MDYLSVLYFGTSAFLADLEKEGAKQLSIFKAKSSRTYRILGPKPINNHNTSVQEPSTKRDPQAILANTIYQTEPRTLFLVERTRTIITQPPNTPQSLPPATRFSVSHKVNQTRQKNQQHLYLRNLRMSPYYRSTSAFSLC